MARIKSDAERGPLGAWAYNTARLLDLSPEQVAARVGVTAPTIRKIEGGSARPAPGLLAEIYRYFREVGAGKQVPVLEPPGFSAGAGASDGPAPADLGSLTEAIQALVEELRLARLGDASGAEKAAAAEGVELLRGGSSHARPVGPTVPQRTGE